jgi:hypothetical protein
LLTIKILTFLGWFMTCWWFCVVIHDVNGKVVKHH